MDTNKQSISLELYEAMLGDILAELGIPTICRELVRALIVVSEYKTTFDASHTDIGKRICKSDFERKAMRERAKYRLYKLFDWQTANRIELIREIEKGHQKIDENGEKVNVKTRYRFILLADMVNALEKGDTDAFKRTGNAAIELGKAGVEVPERPKTYTKNQIRRDRRNIVTKIRKMYEQAVKMGFDAHDYCRRAIKDAERELQRTHRQWKENESRQRRINEVRNLISKNQDGQLEPEAA